MKLFLTSSPCIARVEPDGRELGEFNEENSFVENLREFWKPDSRLLLIAADPDSFEENDGMAGEFARMFEEKDMTVANVAVIDSRNEDKIDAYLWGADAIILSGGHVPTENEFFTRMELREKLEDFEGIVIGISAGSMNSADHVYAQPELKGESLDPEYPRWLRGLGLTNFNILPHYNEVHDRILDGARLYEDITFPDSMGNEFFVLMDGSYILSDGEHSWVFGEAFLMKDGSMFPICSENEAIPLPD